MTTPSSSVVQPEVLSENKMTIQSFLHESYAQVSQQVQDSISFFKDELRGMYKQAETCFTNMILPVNNFLKDHTQIETEFMEKAVNAPKKTESSNIVPLEIALLSPMEENY